MYRAKWTRKTNEKGESITNNMMKKLSNVIVFPSGLQGPVPASTVQFRHSYSKHSPFCKHTFPENVFIFEMLYLEKFDNFWVIFNLEKFLPNITELDID